VVIYCKHLFLVQLSFPYPYAPASCLADIQRVNEQALEYCHSLGIVHSDVKRSNMLWHATRKCGTLIDFGYAKDASTPPARSLSLSHSLSSLDPSER
jgi:serine/threonine protein kinase